MPLLPFGQLVAMLKLSSIYLVVPAHEWAIHWLTLETLHPAVRIQLAYLYDVEEWIEPAFRILLSCRLTTLSIEDTYRLGPRTFAALAKTREVLQELCMAVAYSASQTYGLAGECETPDECRNQWISWFWVKISPRVLNQIHPLPLSDIRAAAVKCDVLCSDCFNITITNINKYPALNEEENIVRSTVQKLLEIQKKNSS
ncbi:hypothetical protein K439DRAFT_1620187 [Ramaria rubella]|nr:hypothetical protein K439DRAFT_1620187 [Ramaria rubella]